MNNFKKKLLQRVKKCQKMGVVQWWDLIMNRSNEKSKNNNTSRNSLAFGRRQQRKRILNLV